MNSGKIRHVYGPVPSRRLGRSLGVDLVPFKACSYDCVYCQLGRTTNKTTERKEYVPLDAVLSELDEKLHLKPSPDYISLAGSGEPTLHSRLAELIAAIKSMTSIPVAVLTNGSLLWMPEVRDGLMEADLVLPSLDAGDERMFEIVNRPHESILFETMVDGIAAFTRRFRGEVWLEVFLLAGRTAVPSEARKIAAQARRIGPSRVQLNTIHRPPAEHWAAPVSGTRLREIKDLFPKPVEIISPGEAAAPPESFPSAASDEDILTMISRRPCTAADVATSLGVHINEALKRLDQMASAGKAGVDRSQGQAFYSAVAGRAAEAHAEEMRQYQESCRSEFWREVFQAEIDYLSKKLEGARSVLSVGCGPATVEKGLSELGFHVTGLDVSEEALGRPPDGIRTVVAPAERMPLPSASFDAVVFVASLQFIDDYRQALEESARVLRRGGKIIVMLLNPESDFVKERSRDNRSYISKIKHSNLRAIEDAMSRSYDVRTEYLLGIRGDKTFETSDRSEAVLYVIRGSKRSPEATV